MDNEFYNLLNDNILTRLSDILREFVSKILDFTQNYLFCLIATGLWIKIGIGILTGRPPGILTILLAIICTAIAITCGAVFW